MLWIFQYKSVFDQALVRSQAQLPIENHEHVPDMDHKKGVGIFCRFKFKTRSVATFNASSLAKSESFAWFIDFKKKRYTSYNVVVLAYFYFHAF